MTVTYHIDDIRTVVLAGHGASGKTSLADALMVATGSATQAGSVDEGTSRSDVDPEERRRHFSIDSHTLYLTHGGKAFHLIDTPGYPDFIGQALGAMAAVENVIISIAAPSGIEANTRRIYEEATRLGLGRFIALTKLDAENVDYAALLEGIRQEFGEHCVPFNLPVGQGTTFQGIDDLFVPQAEVPTELLPIAHDVARQMVVEAIIETDDEAMERYLEGEEPSPEQLRTLAHDAIAAGALVPIVCTCTRKNLGLSELLDLIASCGLDPSELHRHGHRGAEDIEILPTEDGEVVAQVFKTTNDLFMGKLSVLRVHSGTITKESTFINMRTGKTAKPGHLYRLHAGGHTEIEEATAGDIVAIAKFDDLHISDTVSVRNGVADADHTVLEPIHYPTPMVPRAVVPRARKDEPRINASLAKIAEEDPTFAINRDEQTHELVISGMSDLHLDVIEHRLKDRYKLEVDTHVPHVPYRETIRGEAEAKYRHKKQTGGRGQFADVQLKVRPLERGEGFRFLDTTKGGVIPGQYIPAIEKGVREQMARGIIAGFPIVDIEVEVFFGSFHPVDSSEQAFKVAGAHALKIAFETAQPTLLEPIVEAEVVVPASALGDVSGDLASRRGHVTGMDALGSDQQRLTATVPLSEMMRYAADLKGMTGGQGTFSLTFHQYEPVPAHLQQSLIEASKTTEAVS